MIHVAVVEDSEQERLHLMECLDYLAAQENVEFDVTQFSNGSAFIGDYRPEYDIVLMDIEMPGMNGLEAARALRRMDASVILVFVTNMAQYAVNGYDVDALNFIVKPVNKYDFAMKMSRAVARTTKRLENSIRIKTERDVYLLRTADIKYLEVLGHYVIWHTIEGNFTEYTTLKSAEQRINKDFFVRCNRCYLVNLRYISAIRDNMVAIRGDEQQISRTQKKSFLSAYAKFLGA